MKLIRAIRWYWWLLTGPNVYDLSRNGCRGQNADPVFDRWMAKEPKR